MTSNVLIEQTTDDDRASFEAWKASLPPGKGYNAFEAWQAAHDRYAPKLAEIEATNIIMQTDIGIAGDMCIAESHAMQYVKALAAAGIKFKEEA